MGEPATRELWTVRAGTVPYRRAWAWQRALAARRAAGEIPDTVLLLEHPHVYTIGKRGSDADVLADPAWLTANGAEVVRSDPAARSPTTGPASSSATRSPCSTPTPTSGGSSAGSSRPWSTWPSTSAWRPGASAAT